jgi:RNA polymerase sigma-70 factor (ECF subfamily)
MAFDALICKYRPRVLKLALRYTHNRADAEDAVQETFIKAYRGLPRFRGESAFYSWLHRIAINSAKTVRALRVRQSIGQVSNASVGGETAGVSVSLHEPHTPENLLFTDEMVDTLNAVISELSEEQRTAVILRELQGFSYSQVAAEMACPIGTVRSRVSRARDAIDHRLRRVFDDGLGRVKGMPQARPSQHA